MFLSVECQLLCLLCYSICVSFRDWDSYTLSFPGKGWTVKAEMVRIPSSRIFSVSFTDSSLSKECRTEQRRLHFKLEKDWKEDSYVVFSSDQLLLSFIHKSSGRHVIINAPHMVLPDGREGLTIYLNLSGGKVSEDEGGIVKCSGMKVSGNMRLGNDIVELNAKNSRVLFEWGRTE